MTSSGMTSGIRHPATEQLLRELAPQVLGAVMRRFGDFSAAEDAVQEAMIAAAMQWPRDGVPDNPRGWLIQVACRRMADHVRSELARRKREAALIGASPARRADRAGDAVRRCARSGRHACRCCSCAAIPR